MTNPTTTDAAKIDESKKTILLIDDNETFLNLTKSLFEIDYNVVTFHNNNEDEEIAKSDLVKLLTENHVDAIVTDQQMPFYCTRVLEAINELKANETLPENTPVFVWSGHRDFKNPGKRQYFVDKGFTDAFHKSEGRDDLLEALKEALKKDKPKEEPNCWTRF